MDESELTHLSVFALEAKTSLPIARMPVYAEVAVVVIDEPSVEIHEGLREPVRAALDPDNAVVRQAILEALAAVLTPASQDQLAQSPGQQAVHFVRRVIFDTVESNGGIPLDQVPAGQREERLRETVRNLAAKAHIPVLPPPPRITWAYPLGLLASDHVGYFSFDLLRLPPQIRKGVQEAVEARRLNPAKQLESAIWLYPMASDEFRIDALANGSFAVDAIVVRMHLPRPDLPAVIRNLGLLALQNPSLTDWRISPGSFAGNPGALLGADGCETLMPANLALQEFHFYQVIAFPRREGDDIPAGVRFGIVHEYRVAWYHLGHSLGQILYSLPLAPGESVNLAVIDWTRRDDAQRKENTTLDEQIVHNEHRDRGVSETVNAAVNEYQHGSSFMGGIAESGGISGTMGLFGVAAGHAESLGGSTANSSGSRKIAATTVQNISDNITQASAATRELQSTVVVHTNESEKEAIETRTIANYNHSHALTILYYEVLRHFRVVTEFLQHQATLLVKIKTNWFVGSDAAVNQNIQENRVALEAALLNQKLAEHFNALERIMHRAKLPGPTPAADLGELKFVFFTFEMTTGGMVTNPQDHEEDIVVSAKLAVGTQKIQLTNGAGNSNNLSDPGEFGLAHNTVSFAGLPPVNTATPLKWRDISAVLITFEFHKVDDVSFKHIKITARADDGSDRVLVDENFAGDHVINNKNAGDTDAYWVEQTFATIAAPAKPTSPPTSAEEIEDEAKRSELLDHLVYHQAHYSRAIFFGQDAANRERDLDSVPFSSGLSALNYVENRPLEIIGDYAAYPCTDPALSGRINGLLDREPPPPSPNERLVTLPTRGVFAEAKLGHCNASEEIDNTRFWDWQQSPIPHLAPEIAPIQGVTPQPQAHDLQSTPFPQSLVNIVNPPAAPDPTGLSAALTAITTPNIFRDMSGQTQVADLLKKLSDNSISIAEAANRARGILSNQAASSAAGSSGPLGAGGSTSGTKAAIPGGSGGSSQPQLMPPNEQHDRIQTVRNAATAGNITPQDANEKIGKILDAGVPQPTNDPKISLDQNTAAARAFFPPQGATGETALTAQVANVSADGISWDLSLTVDSGSVDLGTPGPTVAKILAEQPGVCFVVVKDNPTEPKATATVALSVPAFVEVLDLDLNAVFTAWHLSARQTDVLTQARDVADRIAEVGNIRLIWNLSVAGPPKQVLPSHLGPGFITEIVLANTSGSGDDYEVKSSASYPEKLDFGGDAVFYLSELTGHPTVGAAFKALADQLAGPGPAASGVEDFAVKFVSRLIGSLVVRLACSLFFGAVAGGPPSTFKELTGFELPSGTDPADLSSYIDRGETAMALRSATVNILQERLPVPPVFK